MRQVPPFRQYTLLGGGRAARHFSFYLETLGLPFTVWTDARNLSNDFFDRLSQTSHLIILVSDSAIAEIGLRIRSHPSWLMMSDEERPVLLHASGATSVEGVLAAHPLMTFPEDSLYSKDFYPRIPITLFSDEPGLEASRLLPALPNPIYFLPTKSQAIYHSLCVVFGNLPQLLWSEAEAVREKSVPIPLEAFRPFMEVSLQNFLRSPAGALTGPFVRKDFATIERHLEALAETPLMPLYSSFVEHFLETDIPGESI